MPTVRYKRVQLYVFWDEAAESLKAIFWKCRKKAFKLLKNLFIRLDLGQASVGAYGL